MNNSKEKTTEIEMIDDRFWLKRSVEILKESPEKLDEGAQRIAAALAWFWTLYSSAASVALGFSDINIDFLQLIIIVSPTIFLFIAYVLAIRASFPIALQFNVTSPEDIKDMHEELVKTKISRLKLSLVFAILTVILIAVAMITIYINNSHNDKNVNIALVKSGIGSEIMVSGSLPERTNVLIRVTPIGDTAQNRLLMVNKKNQFFISIPVHHASQYNVEISWTENSRHTTVQEVVKPLE